MSIEQLLKELTIRFNTDPKRYEKQDYGVLIKLLSLIAANQSNIDNLSGLVTGNIEFKIEDNNLFYTLNGEDWRDLGAIKGEDGNTPYINEETGTWFIGDSDTEVNAKSTEWDINTESGHWRKDGEETSMVACPTITIGTDSFWYINGNKKILARGPKGQDGATIKIYGKVIAPASPEAVDIKSVCAMAHQSVFGEEPNDNILIAQVKLGESQATYMISIQPEVGPVYTPILEEHRRPKIYHFIGNADNKDSWVNLLNSNLATQEGVSNFIAGDKCICINPRSETPQVFAFHPVDSTWDLYE